MFNNKIILKTVGLLSLASFSLAIATPEVEAYNLSPLSFNKMYNLAQNGEVEALRASVRRGMNIDSINQNGDTGLCVAAQNRDAYTYNAFRAAGANPRHPCVQKIEYYEDFVNNSKAVSVTATPREAYGTMGKEKYKISSTTWWLLGGLAVGGGIAALAMSGASLAELIRRPQIAYADLADFDPERPQLPRAVAAQVEIGLKYEGYIKRQLKQVEEFARLEGHKLPPDLDYSQITGLRLEAREKLAQIRPENFGQASRISGVSPADISVLMIYMESRR